MESQALRTAFAAMRMATCGPAQAGLATATMECTSLRRAASALALELLPVARAGLVAAGVEAAEADVRLEDIQQRVVTGQTGAVWQRRCHERLLLSHPGPRALQAMLARYLEQSEAETPIHAWDRP